MKKTAIIPILCAIALSFGASAQVNLIQNPNFTVGGSPSGADWSSSFSGTYFYFEPAVQTNIVAAGWNDGQALWQNTGATIQAGGDYVLSVQAQVGQAPVTGLTLSFQDVTLGWTVEASQSFTFASQSTGPSDWETLTLNVPGSSLSSEIGDTIGVGITMNEAGGQQGWAYADSVSLMVVPEPAPLALLSMIPLGGIALLRLRRK